MDFYAGNIKALRARYPDLCAALETCAADGSLAVSASRSGAPTLTKNGRFVHSSYDPKAEAESFIDTQIPPERSNVIIFGFGLGYHICAVARRRESFSKIFVIEPDMAMFKAALEAVDLSTILGDSRILFFVGVSQDAVYEFLTNKILAVMSEPVRLVELDSAVLPNSGYFDALRPKVLDALRIGAANVHTIHSAGHIFVKNAARNLVDAVISPGINNLFGKFRKVPAIIVSAGPSLDKNVELLHEAKGKSLILATDTAFKILQDHGIRPDLVFTADFKEASRKHFLKITTDTVPIVFEVEASWATLAAYKGPRFVAASNKPFPFWIDTLTVTKGLIRKGMSVAHFVFSAAREMGCDPLVFIGQDLSFPGGFSHARGTTSRKNVAGGAEKKLIKVKSLLTGEELDTDYPMYVYRSHFEDLVKASACRCINATEGGAGIAGTEVMTLRAVIDEYCRENIRAGEIISEAAVSAPKPDIALVRAKVAGMCRRMATVARASRSIMRSLRSAIDESKASAPDPAKISALFKKIRKPAAVVKDAESILRIFHADLIKQIMQLENEDYSEAVDIEGKDIGDIAEVFRDDYEFQSSLNNAIRYVLPYLRSAEKKFARLAEKTAKV